MASIAISLTGANVAGPEQRLGAVLGGMSRAMQIGGIVFDWGWEHVGTIAGDGGTSTPEAGQVQVMAALLLDRITAFAGTYTPVSVGTWSPWAVSTPTAILNTATPLDITEQVNTPTRILWQKTLNRNLFPRQVINQVGGALYVPSDQPLVTAMATVNRRLRLRLDEDFGLYLAIATRNSPTFSAAATNREVRFWARGTLYYRIR